MERLIVCVGRENARVWSFGVAFSVEGNLVIFYLAGLFSFRIITNFTRVDGYLI